MFDLYEDETKSKAPRKKERSVQMKYCSGARGDCFVSGFSNALRDFSGSRVWTWFGVCTYAHTGQEQRREEELKMKAGKGYKGN